MKYIIFAGGHGLRMWPISRKNSPKQFEQIFDGKSTLQLMVERVLQITKEQDIYISTSQAYSQIVQKQVPAIPKKNIIYEPVKRDLAGAVGLSLFKLNKLNIKEPIVILWSDHIIEHPEDFKKVMQTGELLISEDPNRIVFTGETPRFANHNIGWIKIGKKIKSKNKFDIFTFEGWSYRPELSLCKDLFDSKTALWNTGYFITSVDFLIGEYEKNMPEMTRKLKKITNNPRLLDTLYPTLEAISFDDAIVEKIIKDKALVIKTNMGWSDPGTLYALKELFVKNQDDNFEKGNVLTIDNKDSLIYNLNNKQFLATIGLEGFVVVNTDDAIFICHKDKIPKIKILLKRAEELKLDKFL